MRLFNPAGTCFGKLQASGNLYCFFHHMMPYAYLWESRSARSRNVRYQDSKPFGFFQADWV